MKHGFSFSLLQVWSNIKRAREACLWSMNTAGLFTPAWREIKAAEVEVDVEAEGQRALQRWALTQKMCVVLDLPG